ncbi:GyrI-like domain-containing protein [Neisseria sp. Ec49-e6-T10]|uniref:GyrI-like domain-containing protein n=1 Tax=Neisseria sp. Ec49-e6-T10 TaxID=3140744 RepID=UPI003EB84A02
MNELNMCQGLNMRLKPNQPIISDVPAQKVIRVDIQGNPNTQTIKLMPPLYTMAYAIRKIYKEQNRPFKVEKLRGRWSQMNLDQPKDIWQGMYALPIPNEVIQLPEIKKGKLIEGVKLHLELWHYGKTAQILHIGPYTTEHQTTQTLLHFIQQQGYQIEENSHEEIYLSDPNKTRSEDLKTLILYRLKPIK